MSDREYQPLQGDPELLQAKAQHYAGIADAIARSVTTLHKIHDVDQMKSKATSKLRDTSDDVAGDIDKAHDRYQKTAQALVTYASGLRQAQTAANAAIARINATQADADAAHRQASAAQTKLTGSTDAERAADQLASTHAQDRAHAANSSLAAAQQEWHSALEIKNTAAAAAITAIVDVVDHHNNGLSDSWWDDWGKSFFSGLYDVFKQICNWAGVLAIFFSWVPIFGQILIVLAAVGALITIIESTIALINGTGSWGDLLMAVGMGVLTCFGGKIFALIGKNLRGAVALKAFAKAGGDLKAGKALQGPLALGERAAARMAENKLTFRQFFKDPLDLADTGLGFHFNGPVDLIKQSVTQSVSKFTARGAAGEDMFALARTAETTPALLTAGNRAVAVVATVGNVSVDAGVLVSAENYVQSQFGSGG